jgi:hypothetical protein
MEYKILERKGKFLVGTMEKSRRWFQGTSHDEFKCYRMSGCMPAHFDTLIEARDFVATISKPDAYHSL